MQISAALLCLLLTVAAFSSQVLAQPEGTNSGKTCCYRFHNRRMDPQKLRSYTLISISYCPREAVIFKTKQHREVCADPKWPWAQNAIAYLNKKTQTSKP
ncbi:C-C motif chemokine 7 precursor [Oryctolagus cuniculus]|nr:C-C motif chemokine 7 precursor [Oryctolagus cuniculus]AFQ20254.1 C-C motif chemokine ligand 7 [Oryctolagus cuniculus]